MNETDNPSPETAAERHRFALDTLCRQCEAVRPTGVKHMLNAPGVRDAAAELGFDELAEFVHVGRHHRLVGGAVVGNDPGEALPSLADEPLDIHALVSILPDGDLSPGPLTPRHTNVPPPHNRT